MQQGGEEAKAQEVDEAHQQCPKAGEAEEAWARSQVLEALEAAHEPVHGGTCW